jgi:coniferyl-aldehyde dehydrogenase
MRPAVEASIPAPPASSDPLSRLLAQQREAFANDPYPSARVRKDRLKRAINALLKLEPKIVQALDADFGGRHEALSLLTEVMAPVRSLKHAAANVERWMRPEKRKPEFPMGLLGARAYIFRQPLGVVGVVAPWNAPVALAFTPLAGILAAGNRAMIKPSELAPQASAIIAEAVRNAFDESEVAVVEGEADVAVAFTKLPFDHLLYTGSAGIARHVMRAAADHLVPVTLELGGKSPAILARGADLEQAASQVAFGKLANAGQVCMCPDFALVHRDDQAAFADAVRAAMLKMFPDFERNRDYTRVHLPRQRQRLAALCLEAARAGAKVEALNGLPVEALGDAERFPPVIVQNAPADSRLMREEVFGPVLPIAAYDRLEDVPKFLARLSRPLALYFIGGTPAEKQWMLRQTWAGGVTFDGIMLHPFLQDLPFGGVGESGMGRYVGHDGFKTFSNSKSVAHPPVVDVTKFLAPPYGPRVAQLMRRALKL